MSGHSKWSTIKHKKAQQDSKRGKLFGQISKQIRVAVKEGGGGDPNQNPQLRLALEKARAANMPKDNINRAIERGLGRSASGAILEEVVYEGYGPGGVGLMVFAITDNRNRTSAEVRNMMEKAGGSLGGPGAVSYLFEMDAEGKYQIKVPMPISEPKQQEAVEELVENLESHDDVESVITNMAASE